MPTIRKEDTPITIDTPHYKAWTVEHGGFITAFESVLTEADATQMFKGLPNDSCPCPHWGVMTKGTLTLRYADHEETYRAGDVFYCPPGHVPGPTPPGTEFITFSPSTELKEVWAAMARNAERLAAGADVAAD